MMPIQFLFPSDPLKPRHIDEMFIDQSEALKAGGFTCSIVSDDVLEGSRSLRDLAADVTVVYRGWMVDAAQYANLEAAVMTAGGNLLTSLEQYVATHYLPRWYPLVTEYTPETRVFPLDSDIQKQLEELGWDAYFVKDYVKSLKTSVGSIIRDPGKITAVISEMERVRGKIEGGICVRRVEQFVPDTETRYFVLHGHCWGPTDALVPDVVDLSAPRINSEFFSVDVARRADGVLRIVEIGDGQVSDLVGWTPERFAQTWRSS
jgi:hypothetical protein